MYRILSADEAANIVATLDKLAWTQGKARTKDLTGTVKQNEEILAGSSEIAKGLLSRLGKRLASHSELQVDCLPKSVHMPKFSRYSGGGHYKKHTDAPWMLETRTDLSCTLWLNDGYEGGELCIETPEGLRKLKGPPGTCVVYDCGYPHWVEPVTSGERICAVTWMQSRVRDPGKRRLVSDLRKLLAEMETKEPDWYLRGSKCYSALLRRWAE